MPIDVLYLNDKYYIAFKVLFIAIDVKPTHTYYLPKFNKGGKRCFCFLVRSKVPDFSPGFFLPQAHPTPRGAVEPGRAATALRVRRAEHSQTNTGPSVGPRPKNVIWDPGPGQV